MPLIDFNNVQVAPPKPAARTEFVTQVRETVTVTQPESRRTFVGKEAEEWTDEDLRSYVVNKIQERIGASFPRDVRKEVTIFRSFHKRHGRQAGPIAVAAFELYGGVWYDAPISVNTFTIKSDPYFADVIKSRLNS